MHPPLQKSKVLKKAIADEVFITFKVLNSENIYSLVLYCEKYLDQCLVHQSTTNALSIRCLFVTRLLARYYYLAVFESCYCTFALFRTNRVTALLEETSGEDMHQI